MTQHPEHHPWHPLSTHLTPQSHNPPTFHEEGLRESLCLTSRCEQRILMFAVLLAGCCSSLSPCRFSAAQQKKWGRPANVEGAVWRQALGAVSPDKVFANIPPLLVHSTTSCLTPPAPVVGCIGIFTLTRLLYVHHKLFCKSSKAEACTFFEVGGLVGRDALAVEGGTVRLFGATHTSITGYGATSLNQSCRFGSNGVEAY